MITKELLRAIRLTDEVSCQRNTNNIDLMMLVGHDFLPAVKILEGWLEQYRRDLGASEQSVQSSSSQSP